MTGCNQNKALPFVFFLYEEGERKPKMLFQNDAISSDDGAKIILLEKRHKKKSTLKKFEALDVLETNRRPSNTSIIKYIKKFEKRFHRMGTYNTQIS